MFKTPRHINLTIEHQPHASNYETVEEWLEYQSRQGYIEPYGGDAAEMIKTGEVWVVQWYPDTPIGFHAVAAATLERALALANESGNG